MLLGKQDHALIPNKIHWDYGAKDADATRRVRKALRKRLKEEGLTSYYDEFIIPTSKNLLRASLIGIRIDLKIFEETRNYLNITLDSFLTTMREATHEEFNPRSPQQVAEILFEDFKFESIRNTATGAPSTDEDVLETLWEQTQDPFVETLRESRKLAKLKSTYIDALDIMLDSKGFVHPSWRTTGARTGRITAADPPTTTIPRDKTYNVGGQKIDISIRSMYACPPGYEMAYWDKKQGELRCLAIMAGDDVFLAVFDSGEDPHEVAARECLGIRGEVSHEQRVLSKAVSFGVVYGASPPGLAASTKRPIEVVIEFMRNHRKRFKATHRFIDNIPDIAFDAGFLESPFGRRKHTTPVAKGDTRAYQAQRREIINFLPQNTCAEIVAREFNRICKEFENHNFGKYAWPCNIVYDSGQVVYRKKYRKQVKEIILREVLRPVPEMENRIFPVSFGIGNNWSEAENSAKDYFE